MSRPSCSRKDRVDIRYENALVGSWCRCCGSILLGTPVGNGRWESPRIVKPEIAELAKDLMRMTLHGPVPLETTMKLVEEILRIKGK